MNIFKKVKDIFYDDVEEEIVESKTKKEEPQKIEVRKEEPKFVNTGIYNAEAEREVLEKKVVTKDLEERNLYQSKDTFQFPVFDEKDFESTLNRKRSTSVMDFGAKRITPEVKKEEVKEEKKAFRPSPVISPIYGVLDKNYTKEEVVDRKDIPNKNVSRTELNYDSVRRKAYGTLEDDLEDTLMTVKTTRSSVREVDEDINEIDDPKKHIESLLNELERTASLTVGEIEEALKNQLEDDEDPRVITSEFDEKIVITPSSNVEDLLDDTTDFKKTNNTEEVDAKKLENDLFNLIDSMYEGEEK